MPLATLLSRASVSLPELSAASQSTDLFSSRMLTALQLEQRRWMAVPKRKVLMPPVPAAAPACPAAVLLPCALLNCSLNACISLDVPFAERHAQLWEAAQTHLECGAMQVTALCSTSASLACAVERLMLTALYA